MDRMIRNIDAAAYRMLKTKAAAEGRPIGEVLSDAIRLYAGPLTFHKRRKRKGRSIADLTVFDGGPGSENWSNEIDEILYGGKP